MSSRPTAMKLPAFRLSLPVLLCLGLFVLLRYAGRESFLPLVNLAATNTTLVVDDLIRTGGLGQQLLVNLRQDGSTVPVLETSLVSLPFVAAFQAVFGVSHLTSLHVATLANLLIIACVLVILRHTSSLRERLFVFALCAVSPFQIALSRAGIMALPGTAHTFLVVALAWLAGRRSSMVLAALAASTGFLSFFNYQPTRLSIIAAPLAGLCGALSTGRVRRSVPTLGLLVILPVVLIAAYVHFFSLSPREFIISNTWQMPRILTLRNAESAGEVFSAVRTAIREAVAPSAYRLFIDGRMAGAEHLPYWRPERGGVLLMPTMLLALLGLWTTIRRRPEQLLWPVLMLINLFASAFVNYEPRRLVLFEVSFTVLAALGLDSLVRSLARYLSTRTAEALAALCVCAVGAQGFTALIAAHQRATEEIAPVPFATGEWADLLYPPPYDRLMQMWEASFDRGERIVFVDRNQHRNETLGIVNYDLGPALLGITEARARSNPSFFAAAFPRMQRLGTSRALRGFLPQASQKTNQLFFMAIGAWERHLIDRLQLAGANASVTARWWNDALPVPLSRDPLALESRPVVELRIPADSRQAAEQVLRSMLETDGNRVPPQALGLREVLSTQVTLAAMPYRLLLQHVPGSDLPRVWAQSESRVEALWSPDTASTPAQEECATEVLDHAGHSWCLPATGPGRRSVEPKAAAAGLRCAALRGPNSIIVEPVTGALHGESLPEDFTRSTSWLAIAKNGKELLLSEASGRTFIFPGAEMALARELRMPLWPDVHFLGDCSDVQLMDEVIVSVREFGRELAFTDRETQKISVVEVSQWLGSNRMLAFGASGQHLALLGEDGSLLLLRLQPN